MTTQPAIDTHKTEAFLGKAIGDADGMTTTIFAAIGERLGLFKHDMQSLWSARKPGT